MNIPLDTLDEQITNSHATVYCYVITTVKNRGGQLVQNGSAPNFQGGMITLCTCKHPMRSFLEPDEWKGTWIAGFTTVTAGQGGNALVYLMEISQPSRHIIISGTQRPFRRKPNGPRWLIDTDLVIFISPLMTP
jgi:hypothetical protein